MRQTFWNAVLVVFVSLWTGPAFAQQGLPASRWVNPAGGNNAHSSGGRGGPAAGRRAGSAPSGRTHAAPRSASGSQPRYGVTSRGVTDPGFAGRLGRTVGGFGNINYPGMQPLPTTSGYPAPSGFPTPNINSPGGVPGLYGGLPEGRRGRRHHQGYSSFGAYGSGIIYYGVPYYVPVYPEAVPEAAPEPPRAYDIRQYEGVTQSPSIPSPEPRQAVPQPARTVTLLAFKDAMVIAVTDYWMQSYSLVYETSLGVRTVVPLDRLDWALTQQLNFERNVPFVLEARP